MYYKVALSLAALCLVVLAGCGAQPAPAPEAAPAVAQPVAASGEALFKEACAACHNLEKAADNHEATPWKELVDRMISHGAKITPENAAIIVQHLDATYPLPQKQ